MSYILIRYEADNRLEIRKRRKERVLETHFYGNENGKSLKAVVLNSADLISLTLKKIKIENEERISIKENLSSVKAHEKRPSERSFMKNQLTSTIKKEIKSPVKEQDSMILKTQKQSPIKSQKRSTAKEQEDSSLKEEEMRPMKRPERSSVRKQNKRTAKKQKYMSESEMEERPIKRPERSAVRKQKERAAREQKYMSESEMEESSENTNDSEWEERPIRRPGRSVVKKQKERAAKEEKNRSGSEWEEISEKRLESEWEEGSEGKSRSEWKEGLMKKQKDILCKEWEKKNPEEKEEERRKEPKKSDTKDRHRAHYCFFCKNKLKRINWHLKKIHKNEHQVKKIMATEDRVERRLMWKILVAKGDLAYNRKVLKGQGGQLITAIKKNDPHVTKKMVRCENCWDIQKSTRMPRHRKFCSRKLENGEKPPKIYENLDDDGFYEEVVKDMKQGFPNVVLGNKLFYSFGRTLWIEKSSKETKQKLRYLKSLEGALQGEEKSKDFAYFLQPKLVDHIIYITKKMTSFERKNGKIKIGIPSKIPKLIDLVEEVAIHERVNALKNEDEARAKQISNFLVVFKNQSRPLKKLAKAYMKKIGKKTVEDLPTLSDVWVITRHLEEEAAVLLTKLRDKPNQDRWILLRDNLVIWLGLFNRRRGGASEHLKLADYYRARKVAAKDLENLRNLTKEELDFLKSLLVAEIHHKGHLVHLYIPLLLQEALKVFVANRWVADISEENEYVFAAVHDSPRPVRATNVFQKYKSLLPPESRDKMTFTNLRKQGVTLIRVLNLDNDDLDNWALHLGHSRTIQERYYILKGNPESVLKNGKILSILRNGRLKDHVGKKLDDIPLELGEFRQVLITNKRLQLPLI